MSRSRTAEGTFLILCFCCSSWSLVRGLLWKASIRQGFSQQPRSSKAQLLIALKMTTSLVMPQNLVVAVRQNQDIYPANPAVKLTRFNCCICWPSDELFPKFFRPITLPRSKCFLWTKLTWGCYFCPIDLRLCRIVRMLVEDYVMVPVPVDPLFLSVLWT